MASPKDNMEQLEELFRQDGGGYLLIGYETGMDKPHAAISYQLYPLCSIFYLYTCIRMHFTSMSQKDFT